MEVRHAWVDGDVCVNVYMCVYVYVCGVCLRECMHICVYVYVRVCTHLNPFFNYMYTYIPNRPSTPTQHNNPHIQSITTTHTQHHQPKKIYRQLRT